MESTERDARSSIRARHAAARVAPDEGSWQAPYHEPRGSAPRERDHRGGDHPVPSRTRQLSPPSPRVLQREAAGGQGVALAEGAFLMRAARGPRGRSPLRASPRLAEVAASHPTSSEVAPFRLAVIAATMRRARRRAAEGPPQRLFFASRVAIGLTVPAALRRHRACRGTPLQAFSACGCRKLL